MKANKIIAAAKLVLSLGLSKEIAIRIVEVNQLFESEVLTDLFEAGAKWQELRDVAPLNVAFAIIHCKSSDVIFEAWSEDIRGTGDKYKEMYTSKFNEKGIYSFWSECANGVEALFINDEEELYTKEEIALINKLGCVLVEKESESDQMTAEDVAVAAEMYGIETHPYHPEMAELVDDVVYLKPAALHACRELATSNDCGTVTVTEMTREMVVEYGAELVDISYDVNTAQYKYFVRAIVDLNSGFDSHVFELESF